MKTIKIGLSCSPSRIVSDKVIKTKKITISWGGGIGGSTQTVHCTKVEPDDEFVGNLKLTLISGEKISVNPTYIVKKVDCTVVKLISDITAHVNYHNRVCNKAIETELIELHFEEKHQLVNDYTPRHTGELERRIISKFVEQN